MATLLYYQQLTAELNNKIRDLRKQRKELYEQLLKARARSKKWREESEALQKQVRFLLKRVHKLEFKLELKKGGVN